MVGPEGLPNPESRLMPGCHIYVQRLQGTAAMMLLPATRGSHAQQHHPPRVLDQHRHELASAVAAVAKVIPEREEVKGAFGVSMLDGKRAARAHGRSVRGNAGLLASGQGGVRFAV